MGGEKERMHSFYGRETARVRADHPAFPFAGTPADLYDRLLLCWCAETCAPRMRAQWAEHHPTWGQCSVTAFLAQDIFGGRVYGVPLPEGGVHCYNDVNGCVFDLTSEQFGDTKLRYEGNAEQFREKHFADAEKQARYLLLKERLLNVLSAETD